MERTIIISACTSEFSSVSATAVNKTAALMRDLCAFGEKPRLVIGSYQGKQEVSVLLSETDLSVQKVQLLMRKYSQACAFLMLGEQCYYITCTGTTSIGDAVRSTRKPDGDWTFDIASSYYISVNR